jgi:hypothetical protein
MATIAVTFVEKTQNRNLNPPPTGSNVAAWAVSKFVQTPADGTYPTTQSPDATGTTDSSGAVTLSGLTSSDAYYVSIVDGAGMPHWTQPLIAGTGIANELTYVPAPVAEAATAYNAFACVLTSGIAGGPGGLAGSIPGTQITIPPLILTGSGWVYDGSAVQPPILNTAGKDVFINSLASLQLPEFSNGGAGWGLTWTLYLVDGTGANALLIVESDSLSLTSGGLLYPAFSTADSVDQVGSDLVVPSSSATPIKTTSGGIYGGFLSAQLNGPGALS